MPPNDTPRDVTVEAARKQVYLLEASSRGPSPRAEDAALADTIRNLAAQVERLRDELRNLKRSYELNIMERDGAENRVATLIAERDALRALLRDIRPWLEPYGTDGHGRMTSPNILLARIGTLLAEAAHG